MDLNNFFVYLLIYRMALQPRVQTGNNGYIVDKINTNTNNISNIEYREYIYSGSADNTVRKIDSNGNQVWSFTGHTGTILSVAVGKDDNVYSGSDDRTVRKISPDGNEIWSFTGHIDRLYSVVVDRNNNVYSSSFDNTVRKISPDGNEIWSFTGHTDLVLSVAVDGNGNVYSASSDETVRKIDSSGNQVWSFTGHTSSVLGIAVDENGNVYSSSFDNTVRKIDSNGNQVWSFTGHTSYISTVDVDENGNVYSGSADDTVRKIDSNGNQVWSFTGHTSVVRNVKVATNGNIYSGSADFTVRKISPDGNEIWSFTDHTNVVYGIDVGVFRLFDSIKQNTNDVATNATNISANTADINNLINPTETTIQNLSQVNKNAKTVITSTSKQVPIPLLSTYSTGKIAFFKNRYDMINIKLMAIETDTINTSGNSGSVNIICQYLLDPKKFFWSFWGENGLYSEGASTLFIGFYLEIRLDCDLNDNGVSIIFENISEQDDTYLHYSAIITNVEMDTVEPDF